MRRPPARVLTLWTLLSFACGSNQPGPAVEELPTLDVTNWTDTTELFMEYPVLVAGGTRRFAVH